MVILGGKTSTKNSGVVIQEIAALRFLGRMSMELGEINSAQKAKEYRRLLVMAQEMRTSGKDKSLRKIMKEMHFLD